MFGNAFASVKLVTPSESVSKQLDVIQKLTKEQTGKFLNYEDGSELPY